MKHILPLVLTALSYIQYLPSVSGTPLPGFPGFGPGPVVPPTAVSTATSTSSTSTTSTATSTSATPSTSASSTQLNEINSILQNRLSIIVGGLASPSSISAWLSTLGANGQWPASEVDYTTGCAARRSNWPAQEHWQRIMVMAGAWHGGLAGADQWVKDPTLRAAISSAMGYWISRDLTNLACLDKGGLPSCPCSNPDNTLWNTNWFSNIVLIPQLAGPSCLLLDNTLTPTESQYCSNVLLRAYNELVVNAYINGLGYITGANALDITSIGMDYAMLNLNADIMADAYSRTHAQLSIQNMIQGDGIRADDSFDQHEGIIYNGNYGKDFINAILQVEIQAAGTEFAANTTCMQVFEGLFQGSSWMIFRNILTGVLHWDFSVLGRFISYPASDNQATANIKMNLTQVQELGQLWNSSALVTFSQLSGNGTNANAGDLVGNNMYYTNDYMVHRGSNYVSTLRMYSTRTMNTECLNSQNNFGFHLADGVLYTYLNGDEYEDIAAAWDWNLIPGITVDYGATPLNCATTNTTGLQAFVGGASTGKIGIGAMKYTNPLTQTLSWQKAWFFLDNDVQHVMISNIKSTTTAPVYSVLDQRRQSGSVYTGTARVGETDMQTIWHGEVGYLVPASVNVTTNVTTETGVWSTIGTSSSPPTTVNLFTAKIDHVSLSTPVSYTAFPGTDQSTFQSKTEQLRLESVSNTADVSAVFDGAHNTAMVVFWDVSGGSVTFTQPPFTLSATGNVAIIYNVGNGEITVSDPSQTLTEVKVTVGGPLLSATNILIGGLLTKTLTFNLPQGGVAGQSVTQRLDYYGLAPELRK